MVKKLLCVVFTALILSVAAAAAEPAAFPAMRTDVDGVTRYGYLDETGQTVLPFAYAAAGEFDKSGLAAVEDEKWQTAVIDRTGKQVVAYTESPVSVEFSDDAIAYRYEGRSVYYTLKGELIGSYDGAEGFFSDGLLLCRNAATNFYGYVTPDGAPAFPGEYQKAGSFSGGRALVRTQSGAHHAIDATGKVLYTLDAGVQPAFWTIFPNDTIILSNGTNDALYSLAKGAYVTDFLYRDITSFQNGVAMVQSVNRWGLMDTTGKFLIEPTYYYLTYMGEGLYAARGEDGAVSAIDASGNLIYRASSYVGGFTELRYGLSWHGTAQGGLIFFHKDGGYFASLKDAENPTLLSANVVRVTQDGTTKYINLKTGRTLLSQLKKYELTGGLVANTVTYEKFLGYQQGGGEYGWSVRFPEISGLQNVQAQKLINDAIRKFFLEGPSTEAEYISLEGGYGVAVEGSVLIVWANCISGKGEGAAVWNDSIAFDLRTGKGYKAEQLLSSEHKSIVDELLPSEHARYLYAYPRIGRDGITYFYNEYESSTRRAYTKSYLLRYEDLGLALVYNHPCYLALQLPFEQDGTTASTITPAFTDLTGHWAEDVVMEAVDRGLMKGANGKFRPDDPITGAEMCAAVSRAVKPPTTNKTLAGLDLNAWYYNEVNAVYSAGLLAGMEQSFSPETPAVRQDAMRLFGNVLRANGKKEPTGKETVDLLQPFSDATQLASGAMPSAALCIREGLITGTNGKLLPHEKLTRAEFCKLLTSI